MLGSPRHRRIGSRGSYHGHQDGVRNTDTKDEVLHAHEKAHHRIGSFGGLDRTDIPTREDVRKARKAAEKAREQVKPLAAALCQIKRLPGMKDEDALPD
jgi:hypothetical protein